MRKQNVTLLDLCNIYHLQNIDCEPNQGLKTVIVGQGESRMETTIEQLYHYVYSKTLTRTFIMKLVLDMPFVNRHRSMIELWDTLRFQCNKNVSLEQTNELINLIFDDISSGQYISLLLRS